MTDQHTHSGENASGASPFGASRDRTQGRPHRRPYHAGSAPYAGNTPHGGNTPHAGSAQTSRPQHHRRPPAHRRTGRKAPITQIIRRKETGPLKKELKLPEVGENFVRVIPLGGLEEVGKNMLVIETQDDIIVSDVG